MTAQIVQVPVYMVPNLTRSPQDRNPMTKYFLSLAQSLFNPIRMANSEDIQALLFFTFVKEEWKPGAGFARC